MRAATLCLLLLAQAGPSKQEVNKRIEEAFLRLATEKTEPGRVAARAELEAIGRPVLPVVKRFLEEELQRAKKAKEKAEVIADRYVPRLDDDAIESREAATLALIQQGEAILPGLKKYEKSSSAEIRGRVKAVVEAIEARRTGGGTARLSADALQLFARLSDPSGAALVAGFFETREPELRLQAVKAFHEVALPADLAKLKPLLSDADLKVRAQAAGAAADLGLDGAVPMLLELVRIERDPNAWNAALNAMARWRSLWPADVSARVADLLPNAPAERRQALIYAFFRAGRLPEPPETILKAFRTLAPAEKTALVSDWSIQLDPAWLAVLRILAFDPDPAISAKAAAAYGMGAFLRFGGPSVLDEKWDLLAPEDRLCAARALGAMSEGQTHAAFRLLLREKDPAVRKALLEAALQRPTFVGGPTLREALLSGQPDLAVAAAGLFQQSSSPDTRPAFRYVFQTTPDATLRAHLGLSLAAEGDPRGVEHVAPFLKDPHPRLRARACDGVAATRAVGLADAVAPLLKDPDLAVRRAAAQALLACGDPRFMDALWELRADPNLESLAIRAVGKLGRPADVDRLEKHVEPKPALKSQACWALFHLSPLEPHPLLLKLAQDKDPLVKASAQRALDDVKIAQAIKAGPPPPLESRFAYERDFVFVAADPCTPKVAAEKRAIPISLKEFLAAVEVGTPGGSGGTVFSRAAPRACPPELLEMLAADHPRLHVGVKLLRYRPYPEAVPRLAALAGAGDSWSEAIMVLSWCDPVVLRRRILGDIEKGILQDGTWGLSSLSLFTPQEEHILFLLELSKSPAPAVKAAADRALQFQSPTVLCRMLADGRFPDRARVLRSLVRQPGTEGLATAEESMKDPDPGVRALAAAALVNIKGEEAVAAALPELREAPPEAAWELAAKAIVLLKEEHRTLLPADSNSAAIHALLARLGRKESAPRVLEGFPPTPAGKLVAGLALAPHFDAAVEAKLLPLLDGTERDGALGPCAALAKSADAAVRTRVMTALQGIPLYSVGGRMHPAIREGLEALIAKGEPGAVQRAAMYRGVGKPGVREEAVALLRKAGTDEAAALLLDFLNVSIQEIPVATPLVVESIKAHVKGPKTREKLKQLLAAGTFLDHGALVPLFVEMGVEAEQEAVLEQKARGSSNYLPSIGAMQVLARSPGGIERLKKIAAEFAASKESRQRVAGGFAAWLAGVPVPPGEWRARYLQGGGSEATLLVGELRLVETAAEMLRQQRDRLSTMSDPGMPAALPLLTCADLRPPAHGAQDYWPAMAKFLAALNAWAKQNRGRSFEEIFSDALKARGHAGGAADPKALVAALDDKDDFIAANAAWMLRRVSGRPTPVLLSFQGEWGRWSVRRPEAGEVAEWKKWLGEKK